MILKQILVLLYCNWMTDFQNLLILVILVILIVN